MASARQEIVTGQVPESFTGYSDRSQSWRRIAMEGAVAGLIGYATVAACFAVASVVQGESPFFIAARLGAALFPQLQTTATPSVEPGLILAYNGVHLLLFLGAGLFMAWLAALSERAPQAWYPMAVILFFVGAHVVALPIWFSEPVRAVLSLWLVALGTLVAALLMAAFLWRSHPGIRAAAHEPDA
jgi:hypothetical protein